MITVVKTRWQDIAQVIILMIVSALFTMWAVLGNSTVARQNQEIIKSIEEEVVENRLIIQESVEENRTILRSLVCILRIPPEERTVKNTERCLRDAGFHEEER